MGSSSNDKRTYLADGSTTWNRSDLQTQDQIDAYNKKYLDMLSVNQQAVDKRNKTIDLLSPSGSPGRSATTFAGANENNPFNTLFGGKMGL